MVVPRLAVSHSTSAASWVGVWRRQPLPEEPPGSPECKGNHWGLNLKTLGGERLVRQVSDEEAQAIFFAVSKSFVGGNRAKE